MAVPVEYFLFKPYLISIKEWLKQNCYLSRLPEDKNVKVEWLTPSKAFVKYVIPAIERENGSLENPLITFYTSSMSKAGNGETPGQWVKLYNRQDNCTIIAQTHPIVYSLSTKITIFTSLQSDMDILLYEIISKTQHKKSAILVQNQWCEIGSSDPRDETNTNPPEAQDKIIKYSIDLITPRAYLPIEPITYGSIEEIEMNYEVDASLNI